MRNSLSPPKTGDYEIKCPVCYSDFIAYIESGNNELSCEKCGKLIKVFLATVRAKRGKTRSDGEYIIRAIIQDGEKVLRFWEPWVLDKFERLDIDFRSGDRFYISYRGCIQNKNSDEDLHAVIHNFTTKKTFNFAKIYDDDEWYKENCKEENSDF